MNYHGFAASLLDRYGMLAGFEPGRPRAQPGAARGALRPRARPMTFEHAAADLAALARRARSSSSTTRLQNHRVAPDRGARPTPRPARDAEEPQVGARPTAPPQERIELAEAASVYRELKRELGRDRLRRPDRPRDRDRHAVSADVVADHRARFQRRAARRVPGHERRAGRADGGAVRRRAPGDRRRRPRPEHLRVARRLPLQPARASPSDFPRADGTPAARLPLYTNFRSGARILAAADTRDRAGARSAAADPDKTPRARGRPTARARSRSRRVLDEWTEAGTIADRCVGAARGGRRPGPRWRCCAARRGCSGCCSRRSTSAASRSRSSGSPGS